MPDRTGTRTTDRTLALLLGTPETHTRSSLTAAIHRIDPELWGHARTVAALAARLAGALHLPPAKRDALVDAAWLHDIGKLAIDRTILDKPGPLTHLEWCEIKGHSRRAADYLAASPTMTHLRTLVLYHHERYDGLGYPAALVGRGIPLGSRVLAVVDSYDAMLANRPYRPARTPGAAIAELERFAGTQFDPEVVKSFVNLLDRGQEPQDR